MKTGRSASYLNKIVNFSTSSLSTIFSFEINPTTYPKTLERETKLCVNALIEIYCNYASMKSLPYMARLFLRIEKATQLFSFRTVGKFLARN